MILEASVMESLFYKITGVADAIGNISCSFALRNIASAFQNSIDLKIKDFDYVLCEIIKVLHEYSRYISESNCEILVDIFNEVAKISGTDMSLQNKASVGVVFSGDVNGVSCDNKNISYVYNIIVGED